MTSDELSSYFSSPTYGSQGQFFAVIVFHSIGGDGSLGAPGNWHYSIRMNNTVWRGGSITDKATTRPLDDASFVGRSTKLAVEEADSYNQYGFSTMQLMLDRYIVGKRTNANMNIDAVRRLLDANGIGDGQDSLSHSDDDVLHRLAEPMLYQPQSLATVPFPVEGQTANDFYALIKSMLPLMFVVAFLYTQKKVIAVLIVEKES
jgi:hypothetical protein